MKKLLFRSISLLLLCLVFYLPEAKAQTGCPVEFVVEAVVADFPAQDNGQLIITTASGTAPFAFSINNSEPQPTGTFIGLKPGTYTVKVNDALGCESIQEVVLGINCINIEDRIVISGFNGPVCSFSSEVIVMTANIPDGQFTGTGVVGDNTFDPQLAQPGPNPICYRGNYLGCDFDKCITVEVISNCCPVPTQLAAEVINPTQVNLTWKPIGGTNTNYIVAYYPQSDPSALTQEFTLGANTSLTDFDPTKGNRWCAKVRSLCSVSDTSEYSLITCFSLGPVNCFLPNPLATENITSTGATLKWTAVPNIISYRVEFWKTAEPFNINRTVVTAPNVALNATSLSPDTEYQFRVEALCEEDKSSGFTLTKVFRTLKDLNVCDPPQTVTIDDLRQRSAKILWTSVQGAFQYKVCVRKVGEITCNIADRTIQRTELTLTELEPDTRYEVIITTDCGGILSAPTEVKWFTTPPPVPPCPVPTNIKVTNITTNFARVTWDHNPAIARGYGLRFREVGTLQWRTGFFTSRPPFNLNRLTSDTEFEVQVLTYCRERGDSSIFSESVKFITGPDPNCNPPREMTVVLTTTTTAKLDWTRIGNADRYLVRYRVKGSNANYTESLTQVDSVELTNLAPNTLYEFFVIVYCKNGKESVPTNLREFRTQLPSVNCPTPNNIEFANTTGSSTLVSWNPVANAVSYNVYYKKVGGTANLPRNTAVNSLFLDALDPGTTYEIQVQAVCAGSNTSPLTLSQFVSTTDPNGCSGWTRSLGSTNDDRGLSVATDANGNTYTTGNFFGTLTLGNTTLTSVGESDIFVVKTDFAGNPVWAKSAGSTAPDAGFSVRVNGAGEVFVTGFISGEAKFDNIIVNSAGHTDVFAAKYSSAGVVQWVQRAGGNSLSRVDNNFSDAGYGIVPDNTGGCCITGKFVGEATFGRGSNPITLNSSAPGIDETFVACISPTGTYNWARSYGGVSFDMGTGIDYDSDGKLWVSGIFAGPARFGNINVRSMADTTTDAYLMKLDGLTGDVSEVKAYGGIGNDGATAIDADANKEVYLTGYFDASMTINSQTFNTRGGRDVFTLKVNNSTSVLWVNTGGSSQRDEVTGISADDIGSVYVTGTAGGQFPYGDFTSGRSGKRDMFILQLNAANGRTLKNKSVNTDSDFEASRGIATNQSGVIYITGDYRNQALISNNRVTAVGVSDAFTAKFCELGDPVPTCPATKFFLFDDIASNSVKIAWDPVVNTVVGGYVIYYRPRGSAVWQTRPAGNTPFVLDRLVGNTEYEVAIRTVCAPGDTSDFTENQSFRTLAGGGCVPPAIITLNEVTNETASIVWQRVPEAIEYEIRYREVGVPNFNDPVKTANNFYQITGLRKDARYEVQVRSVCSPTASSGWSVLTRFTAGVAVCATPINLKVTATSRNSISVVWSPTSDAVRYNVRWRIQGTTSWTSFSVRDTFLRIVGLTAEQNFEIQVGSTCLGFNNNSTFGETVIGRTQEQCTVPTGIQITDLTGTIAEITWNAAPAALSYEVDYRRSGETNFTTITVPVNRATIPGLNPVTGYEIRIRSLCTGGRITDYSQVFTFSTPILCATPASLVVDRVGLTEIRARWTLRADVKGFFLEYKEEDSLTYTRLFVADKLEETIKGLKPGTNYDVRLRALCDVGANGVPSNYINTKARTRFCETPTITRISGTSQTSVTVEWTPIFGAEEYTIQYRRPGEERWNNVLSVDQTVYTLDGLRPNTEYEIQIWADCFNENSQPSNRRTFTTRPGCAPPSVITSAPSGSSAVVNWSSVPGATGYILQYRRTLRDRPEQFTSVNVATNTTVLTGLISDTPYEVRVSAVCGNVQSPQSNFHDFRTLVNTSCNRPRNYTVVPSRPGSVRLNWDFMTGVQNYVVQYRRANVSESFISITLSNRQANSFTLNGLEPGVSYLVVLRVTCASGAVEVAQSTVTMPAGRWENQASDKVLSVYPNPAKEVLYVEYSGTDEPMSVSLWDMNGKSVWSREPSSESLTVIDLKTLNLPAGIYSVRLQSGTEVRFTKLVIER